MTSATADIVALPREISPGRRALRRLARRRGAMVGLGVVVFFALLALLAPQLAPFDPLATSWSAVRKAPNAAHWFGTDEIGRDVLSRCIYGARASLLAGVFSVCISLICGLWDKSGSQQHFIAHLWARSLLLFSLSPVKLIGGEKLHIHETAVYASNHLSYYDTPVLFASSTAGGLSPIAISWPRQSRRLGRC